MYESFEALGLPARSPSLELEVRVININHGRNEAIAKGCKTLYWYSEFVGKVREYGEEGQGLEEAIRKAIQYCIAHGIMKEYLERHGTEVVNMLLTEWNLEDAKKVWFEEGREEGSKEERKYFLGLLDQGLPIGEIRKRLEQKKPEGD